MQDVIQETKEALILKIKVVPKAAFSEVVGWENGELKVRLKAVPEKGKANEVLIQFLSEKLNIPKSHLLIISGLTSRHKKVSIQKSKISQKEILVLLSVGGSDKLF